MVVLASLLAVSAAVALERKIPADTKRVKLGPASSHSVMIDGTEVWLSAGAKIYNDRNRIVVPGRIEADSAARVSTNDSGEITNVWILSSDEAAQDVADDPRVHVNPIRVQ
jgi:hypothetical protein